MASNPYRQVSTSFLFAPAIVMLLLAAQTPAMESRPVALSTELSPHWLSDRAGVKRTAPAADEIVAVGELSLGTEALADPLCLQLRLPDGTVAPVRIDESTIVREFGRVAFLRFLAVLPAAITGREGFAIEYGDDVRSPNTLVSGLTLDPARRDAFRAMQFMRAPPVSGEPDLQELRVNVIVDSHAAQSQARSRWLFLLPIALVAVFSLVRFFLGSRSRLSRICELAGPVVLGR